jgi:YfiH family protein
MTALTCPELPAKHGFFTRTGGVSTGPYASLNCSLNGGDERLAVLENRARAARSLGADPARLAGVHQVHGVEVAAVSDVWAPGEGPRADAMVTDRPGVALGIITADCAPVLFADPVARVVGAAHAGWRGAVAGVLEATLDAMAALGARPDRIRAAVGPCIAQPSYEVGPDVRDAVSGAFCTPGREGRWQFDLAGYCVHRIKQHGAAASVIGADTLADPERFFSHRRRTLAGGGPIGHQISIVVQS